MCQTLDFLLSYMSSLDLIVVMFVVYCLLLFSDTQTGGPTEGRERRRAATGEGGGGERHAGQPLQTHCSECVHALLCIV